MGWLSQFFDYVPADELKGISLERNSRWEISPPKDPAIFLRALTELLPLDSIFYMEGTSITKDIQAYMEIRKINQTTKVAMGTIWPRPKYFHILITQKNMEGLAELSEKHAQPEIADHIVVYKNGKVLLEWYDAFHRDPFYISKEISEDKIKKFCNKFNIKYKEYIANK